MEAFRMTVAVAAVLAFSMALMVPEVEATKFNVGDSKFWNPNVNYTIWAQGKHFYLGDWLYFVYDRNQQDILEVNNASYQSCTVQQPYINWTRGSGRDVVPLNQTRRYYFISSKGSCYGGMKLTVRVENLPPPPKASAETSVAAPSSMLTGQFVVPAVLAIGAVWNAFVQFW